MDRIRFREVSNAQTGNCGSISAGERKNRLKLGTSGAASGFRQKCEFQRRDI